MSIPTITNNIIQPQNIVINQVPIPVMSNGSNGIPIATALTHAPAAVEAPPEIKTGIVVETIPIPEPLAGARLVGVHTVPVQNTSPAKTMQPPLMAQSSSMHSELHDQHMPSYTCKAKDVIRFKFIRNEYEIEDDNFPEFPPYYTHQIFENEVIFGYKNLKITIFVDKSLSACHVRLSFHSMVTGRVKPDDLQAKMQKYLPTIHTLCGFVEHIREVYYERAFGQQLFTFNTEGFENDFIVTLADFSLESFKNYHMKVQFLSMWYIETANLINVEFPNWQIFYIFHQCNIYDLPIGYCACYKLVQDTETAYIRLSQMVILPHYHGLGLGKRFLHCISTHFRVLGTYVTLSVESPCRAFKWIRLTNDLMVVMKDKGLLTRILNKRFCDAALLTEFQGYLIPKKQALLLFDIIQYYYTSENRTARAVFSELLHKKVMWRMKRDALKKGARGNKVGRFISPTETQISNKVMEYIRIELKPAMRLVETAANIEYNIRRVDVTMR